MNRWLAFTLILASCVLSAVATTLVNAPRADAQAVRRPVDARNDKPDGAPDESKLFVWAMPEDGVQSMIVLDVVDGSTVDAAYLVPVRLKLPVASTKANLEKMLGGRLLPVKLKRTAAGLTGDVWIDKQWLSKKK